jgi:AcrR family transcriptional regulator
VEPAPGTDPARRPRGRPRRSAAEREQHRTRLVEAAIEAIRAGGPDQPLDDLAAAIGVSKPVLYDTFGGRAGLADAIALTLAQQVEATVFERIDAEAVDLDGILHAIVSTLVDLIDTDVQLYAFVVRTLRTDERRFLDNPLVRVLHDRATALVQGFVPGLRETDLHLLVDGVYGFVWATVESWQEDRTADRDHVVDLLSTVIRAGLRAVTDGSR